MRAKKVFEAYGAGFSLSGGFRGGSGGTARGGFGGGSNLGGPNMMYTYEIKPLNHTLEPKRVDEVPFVQNIQIGSKIKGQQILSNININKNRSIIGIVRQIVKTDNNSLKYYIVQDEATQEIVKIDPLTSKLITHDPIQYYKSGEVPSKRRQLPKAMKEHLNYGTLFEIFNIIEKQSIKQFLKNKKRG